MTEERIEVRKFEGDYGMKLRKLIGPDNFCPASEYPNVIIGINVWKIKEGDTIIKRGEAVVAILLGDS
ncbi:hypothetical protein DRO61_07135 [Candidatus Bathyarchaeota archaeon]|nr:MAG: hypothetical protein DRO61_07135 [Candidatus Bathyarchaeota archaeon]